MLPGAEIKCCVSAWGEEGGEGEGGGQGYQWSRREGSGVVIPHYL